MAIVVAMAAVYPQAASADETLEARDDGGASQTETKHHLVYGEVLGKAGLYGVGYEHTLNGRLSLGAAASYAPINDQQVVTIAPYLHVRLFGHRNQMFTELGAVISRSHLPSPVTGWDGMTENGFGALASLGWERRTEHLVLRLSGSLVYGTGGLVPVVGFMVGVPF